VSVKEVVPEMSIRYFVLPFSSSSLTTDAEIPANASMLSAISVMDCVERLIETFCPPICTMVAPGGLVKDRRVPTALFESLNKSLWAPLLVAFLMEPAVESMNPIFWSTLPEEASRMLSPSSPVTSLASTRW